MLPRHVPATDHQLYQAGRDGKAKCQNGSKLRSRPWTRVHGLVGRQPRKKAFKLTLAQLEGEKPPHNHNQRRNPQKLKQIYSLGKLLQRRGRHHRRALRKRLPPPGLQYGPQHGHLLPLNLWLHGLLAKYPVSHLLLCKTQPNVA